MAKAKKITSDTTITINPKSKNVTYEFDANCTFTIEHTVPSGYEEKYYDMPIKKGNDLIIDTLYTSNSGVAKVVSTTFKNYFEDTSAEYIVKYNTYIVYSEKKIDYKIKPSSYETNFYLEREKANDYCIGTDRNDQHDTLSLITYDKKGTDTYDNYVQGLERYVVDLSGNDKHSTYRDSLVVRDYKGNDEYNALTDEDSGGWIEGFDYAGNDTYNVVGGNSYRFTDYKGKDKYNINGMKYNIEFHDKGKGNDTYTINNCINIKDGDYFIISDEKGNETYKVTNLVFDSTKFDPDSEYYAITDESGNDNYDMTGVGYAKFKDLKGNDKITIKNSESVYFDDMAGNDKWTLTGVNDDVFVWDKAGKDKYTLNGGSDGAEITDENGNDKYTVTEGSKNSTITDNGGKDTYNIKGSYNKKTAESVYLEKVTIEDSGDGKDKYNIQYAEKFDIHDYSAFACNDSYNIVYSNGDIYDSNGNDTYTISKLRENYGISIADRNSNKDKLILKDVNKNDLFVIADIKKNGNYRMGALLLFDKKTYGFVEISGYYHTDGSGDIDRTSDGEIETIKAGSKKVNASSADVYGDFNSIRSDVGIWLSGGGNQGEFDSVSDLFASADNGAIQTFIAAFSNN